MARGEVLAFADADLQLHPETFNEIDRVLASGPVVGGTTGIRFERATWSTRKFDQFGDWHYFTAPFHLPWRALARKSALNAFARHYWYGTR